MKWLSNAYHEGILDPEFAIMNKEQAMARNASGHVVLTAMTPYEAAALTLGYQEEGRTDMWIPLAGLQADPDSPVLVPTNTNNPMFYVVPKNLPERKVRAVLNWLDKGLHKSPEQWIAEGMAGEELEFVLQWFGREDLLSEPIFSSDRLQEPALAHFERVSGEWQNTDVQKQGFPQADRLFSRGEYAELNGQIHRKKIEVIMGKLSLEEWRQFINELQESLEYQAMMSELSVLLDE
ncbi:type 2 periplasmic-binding domain-containing protein [Paenibacillus senegalensis]|uniref:ABC transporter substrate-binding protein n=1 Tax=Paenibacillus senegalensis TaxID=1465766 RepID=UPI00028803AA|nr:ABC transporter substrate-binding protein [Paenibacillus senegalensis]